MNNYSYSKIGLQRFFPNSKRHKSWAFAVESPNSGSRIRFGKLEKTITVLIIVGILIVSAFGFLMQTGQTTPTVVPVNNGPTATPNPSSTATNPPSTPSQETVINMIQEKFQQISQPGQEPQDTRGLFEKTTVMNSTAWRQVATYAWNYFQPGKGLDSTSLLPAGSIGWNYFTDWDLGVYIQAVLDAQKMGLVNKDGWMGSSVRLEKVVQFLETRDLLTNTPNKSPYWFYSSNGSGSQSKDQFDVVDAGTLFVALYNLKTYNTSLAPRIDAIVHNNVNGISNRTNYASVINEIKIEDETSTNIYAYYLTSGFALFFPELNGYSDKVLDNILNAPAVPYANVTLPKSTLTSEPLLYSFFYLNNNPKVNTILDMVYNAHVAYNVTEHKYVAFSEGNNQGGDDFIYEWVILSNGDTWKVTKAGSDTPQNIPPVVYTRVAVSFLSIYNSSYSKNTCIYLERAMYSPVDDGYYAGAVNNIDPQSANTYVSNIGCNTNALIVSAARYACR